MPQWGSGRSIGDTVDPENRPRGTLNLVAFGDALFELTTHAPVEAHGAYGMRKATECLWFTIDNAADFEEMLAARLPGGVHRSD